VCVCGRTYTHTHHFSTLPVLLGECARTTICVSCIIDNRTISHDVIGVSVSIWAIISDGRQMPATTMVIICPSRSTTIHQRTVGCSPIYAAHPQFVFPGEPYFGTRFLMGSEKFELSQPECFLFGENTDLNYLDSKPVQVSGVVVSDASDMCCTVPVRLDPEH
jgi:hypothetical protein